MDDFANGSLNNPNYEYTIQTNILVSGEYKHEGYGHRPMKVCFHIPAEDILFHPDYILTSYEGGYENTLCCENEIIFLNRHPKGWMNFKTSDIIYTNEQELERFIKEHEERKYEFESLRIMDKLSMRLRFLNDNDYYFLMDTKFISLYEELNYLLNRLTPLQRNVIKLILKHHHMKNLKF